MSLDRDGSKLLENSLKMIGNSKFDQLQTYLIEILVQLVATPFEHMADGFEQRKISDGQVFFNDILVSKYGNYVIQTAIDRIRSNAKLRKNYETTLIKKIKMTSQLLSK